MSFLSDQEGEVRARRAVESILENESLTADLDDVEAQRLLEWGIVHAKRLAAENRGSLDDELGALRRLMRGINKLLAERRPCRQADDVPRRLRRDDNRLRRRLERLVERSAGLSFSPPDGATVDAFVAVQRHLPAAEKLEALLALFRK
jgi:hypothetical protein